MRIPLPLSLACLILVASTPGWAQRNFGARPAPGEMLPDVTAYDAAGKEFPLRSLRGQYTVFVFGCLT